MHNNAAETQRSVSHRMNPAACRKNPAIILQRHDQNINAAPSDGFGVFKLMELNLGCVDCSLNFGSISRARARLYDRASLSPNTEEEVEEEVEGVRTDDHRGEVPTADLPGLRSSRNRRLLKIIGPTSASL